MSCENLPVNEEEKNNNKALIIEVPVFFHERQEEIRILMTGLLVEVEHNKKVVTNGIITDGLLLPL